MRPLRLELEGFTCFREKQEALSFENLHLFAIAGPTGAGKSSLLDAMIFALYGRVPRLKRNISELISLGKDRMSVTFDFRLGGKDYRVARVAYRSARSAKAMLEERRGDQTVALADAVRPVEQKLQALLGLDYETFIRAVVLPQGEFAAFLKSDASKRREILRRLLRLEIYRRMQQQAGETKRRLGDRLDNEERRLEEDFGDATRAALIEKREMHERLQKELERHTRRQRERTERFEDRRRRQEQCAEWDDKRVQFDQLTHRDGEIENLADRLQADERARPLLPFFDRLNQARRRLESAQVEAKQRKDDLHAAEGRAESSRQILKAATTAAETVPELQQHIQALDRIAGLFEPRDKARLRLGRLREERVQTEQKAIDSNAHREALEAALAPAQAARKSVSGQLQFLDYDADLDHRLDRLRDPATQLRNARREAIALANERQGAKERQQQSAERHSEVDDAYHRVHQEWTTADAHQKDAETELAHLRDHHRVASLRQELHSGEPCPVCEQTVGELPQTIDLDDLDAAASRVANAQTRFEEVSQRLIQAKDEATRAHAEWQNESRTHERLSERAENAVRGMEAQASELRQSAAEFDLPMDQKLEDALLNALAELAEKRRVHSSLAQELQRLEHDETTLIRQIADAQTEELQAQTRRVELRETLKDLEEELRDYTLRIREVTTVEDPAEERRQLAERADNLLRAEREAADTERQAELEHVTAREKSEASQTRLQRAGQDAEALRADLTTRIEASGLVDEASARAAILSEATRTQAAAEIEQHRQRRAALTERLTELEAAIGSDRVEADELDVLRQEVEHGRNRETDLVQQVGSSSAALEILETRVTRRAELQKQFADLRTSHRLHDELWVALRSDHFEAYLLEQVFRNLVQGASVRLLELSRQRYELAFADDAFQVVDRDNANQTRSTDTLSGGETFLASLSLALELSEQIQREAGAVPLDSIFIDEGFGTLDPDTLDVVTEAIEALPDRGRTVGIITHVPELTRRLPFRVRVERREGRSSYRIEEG